MQTETNARQQELSHRLQNSLHQAESYSARLRTTYDRLVVGGLVTSAVTTLVAGGTALAGPMAGSGDTGWRLACTIAALFSLVSTICVGIGQQLKLGERVPKGQLCAGQLRALDVQLAVGTSDWSDIAKEYEQVLKNYSDVFN
jgi:hypothetical protein